ncbi:MAG: ABC transporter permease subunit [Chthoniobacteraceae bacterium]
MKFPRTILVYFLLIGGSFVFVWPFLWMAGTSVKIDREMFSEQMKLLPGTPVPAVRSPYIDTRYFPAPSGAMQKALLSSMERQLAQMDYAWPDGVDRAAAIKQTARGLLRKLQNTEPDEFWKASVDVMEAEAAKRLDKEGIDEVVRQVYRSFAIGQLRARSYDLQDDQLVPAENAASIWEIGGNAGATLVQHAGDKDPYAELHYDFSKGGDTVILSQTFATTFPVERLHQLQFYYRSDDSWHAVTAYVEKLGVRYKATRTVDLGDIRWGIAMWQEPGPDDLTNKVRNWILLKETGRGAQLESDPHRIKVTIVMKRTGQLGAWLAKIRRSYRKTLDYIPFWRYVETSLFLVILSIVGTMFSCSLVAYSFARLQWPGRSFCFLLMLGTMMIPGQVTMIPYFAIIRTLGWYNTLLPLWVPHFFAAAFNVFLIRQFMKGIPRDLEDAAKIDGCGFLRIYWSIMLPLIRPALATIAILTFMSTWNDFMGPLIYLSDQRLYPLSFGLYALNVEAGGDFGMMMAGSLLMTLPVIATFFFAQKYFLQGLTLTGMKG